MMTSHERLLEASSRLWDRTRRSCVIRIVTVDSAGFSSHGVSTTIDTSDQMLLTPGCTCLWGTTVQCDEGTCWLTYSEQDTDRKPVEIVTQSQCVPLFCFGSSLICFCNSRRCNAYVCLSVCLSVCVWSSVCACVCGLGVCNECTVGGLCNHQSAVRSAARCHVSVMSAGHVRRHPAQDDLPSRPRSKRHSSVQLLRECFDQVSSYS